MKSNRLLRLTMRRQRRRLSLAERRRAAQSVARQCRVRVPLRRRLRVGLYWPVDGEIDPRLVMQSLPLSQGFLPVLDPSGANRLLFAAWGPETALAMNRFGIPEPQLSQTRRVPVWSLDVMLVPLVAFDNQGHRLGMGGGFYDRTLVGYRKWPRRPLLLGLGYSFQQVSAIATNSWDVPMDMVIAG